jgi:hypothetical protein
MSAQLVSILGLALMTFGFLGGAFVMGTKYESKKQGAKYAEEVKKLIKELKSIRADVESGKLPPEYRD